ncbi:MAG: hypothetical protein MUE56_06215 [Ignavibacteria bacterium]|jgi:protein-S-isoprenylcysteine O-methyltransferase Ste14|nr:hypothetical protein [Ignavibacteria bacterium]
MTILPKSFKSVLFVVIQLACIIVIFISGTVLPGNFLYYFLVALFSVPGIWALAIMKFRFNVAPELLPGSQITMSGPYKYIRHPMYSTVLGTTLMVVIFSFTVYLMMIWMILFVTLLMKLSYEESLLEKEFGGYADYQTKTKRIIPFIF